MGASAQALQVDGRAGESDEAGCAKMCDPTREEKRGPGCEWVGGINRGVGEEVARVVESHDDHEEAAEKIDGGDAAEGRWCGSSESHARLIEEVN